MNPLIQQRLHVFFFVFGGLFVFAGLACLGLPVYTMASHEKVQAVFEATSFTHSNGNSTFVYDIPRQLYRFTPKGGTQKRIFVASREHPEKITVYFHHTPESEAEVNLRDDHWRNSGEVTVLLTVGLVLFILGGLGIVAEFVIRASNSPPSAIPVAVPLSQI